MMNSISIKFYLHKNKKRNDEFKIYGRLIVDRKKSEFATNYYISSLKWDENKGRAKRNTNINDDLGEIENTINKIRRKIIDDGKPITSKIIILILKGDKKEKREFLKYMQDHISDLRAKGEHASNTINHYSASLHIYKAFIKYKYRRSDYPLKMMDYEFIKELDLFLMTDHRDQQGNNIKRNTANKHHSRLRTMLWKAFNESLITENPYTRFQLKNTPTTRTFLTPEEISSMRELDLSNNLVLDRVRDFFLFSCYTSLRFGDAYDLKMEDIITTNNNRKMISIKMIKTKEMVHVPLIDEAWDIIKKYEAETSRIVEGYILPRYSNQKINLYLKHIAVLVNITKELTHHVARHTFATIALNNSIPLEVVQKLLGHNSIRTTQIYAKMQTNTIEKEMEKFRI